jgi:hypothetical protein
MFGAEQENKIFSVYFNVGCDSLRVAWSLLPRLYISPNALGQLLHEDLVSCCDFTFYAHQFDFIFP